MHMQPAATAALLSPMHLKGEVLDLEYFKKLVEQKKTEAEQRQEAIRQKLASSPRLFGLTHEADFNPPLTEADKWALINATKVIQRCREALGRIGRGAYGICTVCRQPINERRLKVIPFAPKCVGCKSPSDED